MQQKLYDLYRLRPPTSGWGSGTSWAYRCGWSGTENQWNRSSLCYAAWKAGRDTAKANPVTHI